jgi:hypothetical protein
MKEAVPAVNRRGRRANVARVRRGGGLGRGEEEPLVMSLSAASPQEANTGGEAIRVFRHQRFPRTASMAKTIGIRRRRELPFGNYLEALLVRP